MGRIRQFDREQAIDDALRVFWLNGFDQTSLEQLLKAMGIKNSSFYQAFSSKENLFIEVLARYRATVGRERLDILASETMSLRQILLAYFENLITKSAKRGYPIGCFITNTAANLSDPDSSIGTQVLISMGNVERGFQEAILRAQKTGELRSSLDAKEVARVFVTQSYGLTVIARAKKNKRELLQTAENLVELTLFGNATAVRKIR